MLLRGSLFFNPLDRRGLYWQGKNLLSPSIRTGSFLVIFLMYLLYALAGLAGIAFLYLVYIALQPNDFRVARSITIAAPPAAVFPKVNNFQNWPAWSPWEKYDPNMKRTYSGPREGEGAQYAWEGNDNIGVGKQTIVVSRSNELVELDLQFEKPFVARNVVQFTFEPQGKDTVVSWIMTGHHVFMMRAILTLMGGMDKMVGANFEEGLQNLKRVVETGK